MRRSRQSPERRLHTMNVEPFLPPTGNIEDENRDYARIVKRANMPPKLKKANNAPLWDYPGNRVKWLIHNRSPTPLWLPRMTHLRHTVAWMIISLLERRPSCRD